MGGHMLRNRWPDVVGMGGHMFRNTQDIETEEAIRSAPLGLDWKHPNAN